MIYTNKTSQRSKDLHNARWAMEYALHNLATVFSNRAAKDLLGLFGSQENVYDQFYRYTLIEILDEMASLADEGNFDALGFFKNQKALLLDQINQLINK